MKAQAEKPITPAQIKAIHAILNKCGHLEHKAEYIKRFTGGRTDSCKCLTFDEARRFIGLTISAMQVLKSYEVNLDEKQKVTLSAIWKIAWHMKIIYGDTQEDYEMNKAKLNLFCKERGTVKKNLTQMNLCELRKTHRQFEAMFKKYNEHKTNQAN